MWADNETDIDLLGFDFLVDGLIVALTEPRLLPLTVGVLGDWGSGKSSLMRIVRQELESIGRPDDPDRRRYVCVQFSPWQYEDYDDVKVALMSAVLDRLQPEIKPEDESRVSGLRQFVQGLRRRTRWLGRAAMKTVPAGATFAAHALDPTTDPTTRGLVQAGATAAAAEGERLFAEPSTAKDGPTSRDSRRRHPPVTAQTFAVARNPEVGSRLPYLLRLPLAGGQLVLKARESWPRTAKVYCHRVDGGWPDGVEVLEKVPVRVCERRGVAIDLVLDRDREHRSQLVFTTVRCAGKQARTARRLSRAGDYAVETDDARGPVASRAAIGASGLTVSGGSPRRC